MYNVYRIAISMPGWKVGEVGTSLFLWGDELPRYAGHTIAHYAGMAGPASRVAPAFMAGFHG